MYQSKRNRITTNDDDDVVEYKRKLRPHTSMLSFIKIKKSKRRITSFEDLSNDVIVEMFEYLDGYDIYRSFVNLNIRFQNLASYLNIPLKLNFTIESKSTFQNNYVDFIKPMKHQIKSLHISDPITNEYMFSMTENISVYSELRTLSLCNIESHYLEALVHRLAVLPNLSSLTVHLGQDSDKINTYILIFQLPALKYCDLTSEKYNEFNSLPVSINTLSPIERLIIEENYSLNEVNAILSYVPKIRHLSMRILEEDGTSKPILVIMLLKNSRQVSFTLADYPKANEIQEFLKTRCDQIELLHFSMPAGTSDNHVETFKISILPYLPYSKIFLSEHIKKMRCDNTFDLYNSFSNGHTGCFNDVQQWFFTPKCVSDEYLHDTFCSFLPHRKSDYKITEIPDDNTLTCHVKNTYNSTRHVVIERNDVFGNYTKSFPNTVHLTLNRFFYVPSPMFDINGIYPVVPLTQLTELSINESLDFGKLIDVLFYTPNIHTLTLSCITSYRRDILLIRKSEIFRLVTKQNKIKRLSISYDTLRKMKLFIRLCRKLQHLTLYIHKVSPRAFIRYLLTRKKKTSSSISSICFPCLTQRHSNNLKYYIKSKKSLAEYHLKSIHNTFYLWW